MAWHPAVAKNRGPQQCGPFSLAGRKSRPVPGCRPAARSVIASSQRRREDELARPAPALALAVDESLVEADIEVSRAAMAHGDASPAADNPGSLRRVPARPPPGACCMTSSPALQRFIDDELARMSMLAEGVCRQTADALRTQAGAGTTPTAAERMQRFDLAQALEQQAQAFARAFVEALAARLRHDGDSQPGPRLTEPAAPRGLALVDDAAHSVDIEIARCAALIGAEAEWELRELQTFTSALAGLAHVSVHANPLRPEAFALALWEAADALPQLRGRPLVLRSAAAALAAALRREFAAACTRLEAQGVQPSQYRTAVPNQAERGSVLAELLTPAAAAEAAARAAAPVAIAASASSELLRQLFDGIDKAGALHPALRTLLGLVQALAAGLAAREPRLLDNARHPLWLLLDRFGYQSVTHPNPGDPQLLAWVGLATERVALLQALPLHDGDDWAAAVAELDRYDAAQFNAQLQQAAGDIAALRGTDTGQAGLDIASMDTVPADLLDSAAAPADADRAAGEWLDAQAVGGWYRVFLRGRWVALRLLWHSPSRARWLFAAPWPQRNDAFNRDTLVRLRAEKLIRPLVERSLVVRAAESLRRRLTDGRKST